MAKEEDKKYAALEITSKAVRLVYGYYQDDKVYVLHALETTVNALDGGLVVDQEALTNAIRGVINAANETLNIKIEDVLLALPSMGLLFCRESRPTTTIDPNNVIAQIDINNAISQLKKYRFSDNSKIVDVVPFQYVLDSKEYLPDAPIGKVSQTLTVHASIFALDQELVSGYVTAVQNAGLFIRQLVVAPYAASLYMSNEDTIPSSYYLLNIGSEITTLTQVSQNDVIYQNACFKFGSEHLTHRLQDKFDLSYKEATMLKEKYGLDRSPSYRVNVLGQLQLDDISDCLSNALEPLVTSISKQVSQWSSNDHRYLPIVITGGGSKLYGLKSYLEKKLGLQVIDYTPYSFGARNKAYQVCLGLITYAGTHLKNEEIDELTLSSISRTEPKPGKKTFHSYSNDEEL